MNCETETLAYHEGFGTVFSCSHGMVHVQLGTTTLTLSPARYHQFVAMLCDSAATFELNRQERRSSELGSLGGADESSRSEASER